MRGRKDSQIPMWKSERAQLNGDQHQVRAHVLELQGEAAKEENTKQ